MYESPSQPLLNSAQNHTQTHIENKDTSNSVLQQNRFRGYLQIALFTYKIYLVRPKYKLLEVWNYDRFDYFQ